MHIEEMIHNSNEMHDPNEETRSNLYMVNTDGMLDDMDVVTDC